MVFGIKLHKLVFNDGTELSLTQNEILVITGSNNSGKSQVLRDINKTMRLAPSFSPIVLTRLSIEHTHQLDDYKTHINQYRHEGASGAFYYDENNITSPQLQIVPREPVAIGNHIYSLFYTFLENDSRLTASAEASVPDLRLKRPRRGIIALINNDERERNIDRIFETAFGQNLILDRTAGSRVSFCVGTRSNLEKTGQVHSKPYVDSIRILPRLHEQGDGMRAFVTILAETLSEPRSLVMIDEPESFLHPPQIRRAAEVLATEIDSSAQLVIATHSDELVKGLLDAAPDRIRVVRLRRLGTASAHVGATGGAVQVNKVAQLDPPRLRELWKDPLLRTSDAISALFHDVAIIVEGEVDARFYRALLDSMVAMDRSKTVTSNHWRVPDVRFYYGAGKGSIPKLASQLRAIEVPVLAVADIDLLETEGELRNALLAFGKEYSEARDHWKILSDFMRGEKPANSVAHIEAVFTKVVSSTSDKTAALSREQRETIVESVRNSTTWMGLRKSGAAWFTTEMTDATPERHIALTRAENAFRNLVNAAEQVGLHILQDGSVESFSPRDGSKNIWLENVLKRDLAADPELEAARKFMSKLVSAAVRAVG